MALLEIHDLHVSFPTTDGVVQAVRGVSFTVDSGQTLGIVGESGSGRASRPRPSWASPAGARISGQALFQGRDLLTMTQKELREIRGAEIAMIFQDPLSSLHPYYRVGWQIVEMIRAHEPGTSKKEARKRAVDLLRLVGIPQPDRRVDDYPHQFSGGMRQRAMIAMAMSLNPALLIADEPTTALDVTVQAQVLNVIERLQEEFGTAVILITHDLGRHRRGSRRRGGDVRRGGDGDGASRDDIFYQLSPPLHRGPAALAARRTARSGFGSSPSPGSRPA